MSEVIEGLLIGAHIDIPDDIQKFFDKYGFDPQRCVRVTDASGNVNFLDCIEHVEYDSQKNIVKKYSDEELIFYGYCKNIINGVGTWVCYQSGRGILP